MLFLASVNYRKHRTILTTIDATGLRISECVPLPARWICCPRSSRRPARVRQNTSEGARCVRPGSKWRTSSAKSAVPIGVFTLST